MKTKPIEELVKGSEPKWALHIRFMDGSNPTLYRSMEIHELIETLAMWNHNYKLWPDQVEDRPGTHKHNFIYVMAERREFDPDDPFC